MLHVICSCQLSLSLHITPCSSRLFRLRHKSTSSRLYIRSQSLGASTQEEQTRDDRRLNTIESAVHTLWQQQTGASAQLSVFSEKVDLMEERIKLSYPCHIPKGIILHEFSASVHGIQCICLGCLLS